MDKLRFLEFEDIEIFEDLITIFEISDFEGTNELLDILSANELVTFWVYDTIPFVNIMFRWYNRLFALPYIDIGLPKTPIQLDETIADTAKYNYRVERVETVEGTLEQYQSCVNELVKRPILNLKRLNEDVPLEENEAMCVTIPWSMFEVIIKYFCVSISVVAEKHLEIILLSYDSEIVTCTTKIIVEYDHIRRLMEVKIVRMGYLNPKYFGLAFRPFIGTDTFEQEFTEWVDEHMKYIISMV